MIASNRKTTMMKFSQKTFLLLVLVLMLTSCSFNGQVVSPTPQSATKAPDSSSTNISKATMPDTLPVNTPTIAATQTPTAVIAPTATPTNKPFTMPSKVDIEVPTPSITPVSFPPSIDKMDLSEFGQALTTESKADLTTVQAMQPPIYNITIKVVPDAKMPEVTGHEQIFYTNNTNQTLPDLILWLYANAPVVTTTDGVNSPMAVSNVKVNGQFALSLLENNASNLDIKFDQKHLLQPGETISVELDFKLEVPTDLETNYFRFDAANNIFALLYWYPQLAVFDRKLTNGWDTHSYNSMGDITNNAVSFFKVWLIAPASEVIAANAIKKDSYDNVDGTHTTLLVSGPVRDFVISLSPNYQTVSQKVGSTTVNSYFVGRDKVFGSKALEYAANALQTYIGAFGRYPYSQFNVVEAPLVPWGGLEFPGEIYITTRYYVPSYAASFEFAVVHETAHQWWYGMVGSDQIQQPWQDEALTQYSGVLYYERFHDTVTLQKIYNTYFKAAYAAALDEKKDGIVASSVYAYTDISTYSIIVYNKGGLFYDTYRKQFGNAAFNRFTHYYLEHNRYKFVGPDELIEALHQGVNNTPDQVSQVTEMYRHWILAAEGAQDRAKLQ